MKEGGQETGSHLGERLTHEFAATVEVADLSGHAS